jgi:cyclopropane fatty-acyl-phospholipid synthase-like methyltransferase
MAEYIDYLESISDHRTFVRKCAWLKHNFGTTFKAGQRVLELGPGRGEFLHFAAGKGIKDIDVIDRDSGVLSYIQSRYPVRRAWAASAEDLQAIDQELGMYDRIFALQIVEHIETKHLYTFLQVLYKHLTPGGQILITVPNGGNPLGLVERYSDITHHNLFSENSLKQLVQFCELPRAVATVRGYKTPLASALDYVRVPLQWTLHLLLKLVMIANGGVFFSLYHPNITLVVEKQS